MSATVVLMECGTVSDLVFVPSVSLSFSIQELLLFGHCPLPEDGLLRNFPKLF